MNLFGAGEKFRILAVNFVIMARGKISRVMVYGPGSVTANLELLTMDQILRWKVMLHALSFNLPILFEHWLLSMKETCKSTDICQNDTKTPCSFKCIVRSRDNTACVLTSRRRNVSDNVHSQSN